MELNLKHYENRRPTKTTTRGREGGDAVNIKTVTTNGADGKTESAIYIEDCGRECLYPIPSFEMNQFQMERFIEQMRLDLIKWVKGVTL